MLDVFNKLLANQFDAALCTLNACVDACPDTAWNGPVVNLKFCQVAFMKLSQTPKSVWPISFLIPTER